MASNIVSYKPGMGGWFGVDEYGQDMTWRADNPTPSGGNFGNTVTGAQDIYNTDIQSDQWFQDFGNRELPGPDPSLFTINPGGGGGGGSSWDQYEAEVAKMGKGSTNMGGTPTGSSGGVYGRMTLQQARNQTMGIQQYNWEEQQKILDKQWNDRFAIEQAASDKTWAERLKAQTETSSAEWNKQQATLQAQWESRLKAESETSNKTWSERFAAENAKWAEQAKTTQALSQETWDKQRASLNQDWTTKFGAEQEAARKAWQEQFDAANKEWGGRFGIEQAASDKSWAEKFAATNAQWAEQAKTSQKLSQETWDKQYETMQKDWDAKFGKTNEAERAKWAEQFAAANTEWERRYNLEKNKITTTRVVGPTGPMPTAGEMPTFAAPARNEGRIKELTQQKSAAGLRAMRAQIQKAMGQGYRNANVKRMTLRDALAGYGQGIENVMTGAQTAATGEYNTEYMSAYDTAGKNWQAAYQTKMQDWQNKVNDYFKNYGTVTTTS